MGFQSAREEADDKFGEMEEEVFETMLEKLKEEKRWTSPEISAYVLGVWAANGMEEFVFDLIYDTIKEKITPVIKAQNESATAEQIAALVLAFMTSWKSFGKNLTYRIMNTRAIIREGYFTNTKRIYNDTRKAIKGKNPAAKVFGEGLSRKDQKTYKKKAKKNQKEADEFLEEKFNDLSKDVSEHKNKYIPRHFTSRTTETEALTMRMDLALTEAGKDPELDYITISVKPQACQICESFRAKRYKLGDVPHLLAHPHCRCDYIIHYKDGTKLIIPGSGRVTLANTQR